MTEESLAFAIDLGARDPCRIVTAACKLQLDPVGQLGRGNLFSEKLLDELVQKGGA